MSPAATSSMFFRSSLSTTSTCCTHPLSLHDALPIYSTRNKTRDGLIRVRNIRALNGRFNTSITHAYSIKSAIQGSKDRKSGSAGMPRPDLVCRLLLEKKNATLDLRAVSLAYLDLLAR